MSLRLFVALELDQAAVDALADWRPRHDALRPVAREALHATLAFLGARDEADVPVVGSILCGVARPVRALSLGRTRWLPQRRPRLLAVEVADGDGALHALQSELAGALDERLAGWSRERRAFLAHVTVARVRSSEQALATRLAPPPAVAFAAPALTLFRSRLSQRGARYEALERVPL